MIFLLFFDGIMIIFIILIKYINSISTVGGEMILRKLRKLMILGFIIALLACSKEELVPEREKPIYLKGRLLGYEGKPMKLAHVHAELFGEKSQSMSVEAGENGEFSLPITNSDFIKLEFTGVDHQRYIMSFFNTGNKDDLELDIKLEPNRLLEDLSGLSVIGTFNNFSFNSGLIKMKENPDGNFTAVVPNIADTLYYQVFNSIPGARSVNGTMSAGYVYDGGGDYRSYLVSPDSLIKITFDPDKSFFPYSELTIETKNEGLKHYLDISKKIKLYREQASGIYRKTKDVKSYFEYLLKKSKGLLAKEEDEAVRLMLSKIYIESCNYTGSEADSVVILEFLDKIGANSTYWESDISTMTNALNLLNDSEFEEKFVSTVIDKNPSAKVKQSLLYNLIRINYSRDNKEQGDKYYNQLIEKFPDSKYAELAKKEYSPQKNINVGKIVPPFSFENLNKPGSMITNETLLGKYCLIDIWAVWCGPCVSEMPNLHKTYKKFRSKKFNIFSMSIDAKKEDIAKFRKGKWRMPWLHSFSPGVWDSKAVEFFEVTGIPKPMLINPEGKIVEIGVSLRGENLGKTLEKYLK
jgi:thiol-disulfide isomerase/thioredoxin